jgi:hypothetical protein
VAAAALIIVLAVALVVVLDPFSSSSTAERETAGNSGTTVQRAAEGDGEGREGDSREDDSREGSPLTDDERSSSSSPDAGGANQSDANRSNADQSDYIIPDSGRRYLSESEIRALSDWECFIARNEIFARYGRGFANQELRDYFASKSWYVERYSPSEFDSMASPLNDYELKNADLILSIERARGSAYAS